MLVIWIKLVMHFMYKLLGVLEPLIALVFLFVAFLSFVNLTAVWCLDTTEPAAEEAEEETTNGNCIFVLILPGWNSYSSLFWIVMNRCGPGSYQMSPRLTQAAPLNPWSGAAEETIGWRRRQNFNIFCERLVLKQFAWAVQVFTFLRVIFPVTLPLKCWYLNNDTLCIFHDMHYIASKCVTLSHHFIETSVRTFMVIFTWRVKLSPPLINRH